MRHTQRSSSDHPRNKARRRPPQKVDWGVFYQRELLNISLRAAACPPSYVAVSEDMCVYTAVAARADASLGEEPGDDGLESQKLKLVIFEHAYVF